MGFLKDRFAAYPEPLSTEDLAKVLGMGIPPSTSG